MHCVILWWGAWEIHIVVPSRRVLAAPGEHATRA